MVFVTGDTHGEQSRLLCCPQERTWTKDDCIIVCGDWGFLFEDSRREHRFLDDLERRPYTMAFVDGNHECFPAINRCPEEEWNGGKVHRIRKNIVHLMRGEVFTIQGKRFFTFGGAWSIDRVWRVRNVSWWEEEVPCDAEYRRAIANLERCGWEVDIILTHTAPERMVLEMGFIPQPHERELIGFLEYLRGRVRHHHWYCGHWHMDRDLSDKFHVLWFDTRRIV